MVRWFRDLTAVEAVGPGRGEGVVAELAKMATMGEGEGGGSTHSRALAIPSARSETMVNGGKEKEDK